MYASDHILDMMAVFAVDPDKAKEKGRSRRGGTDRARFASSVILVMLASADKKGRILLSRTEIAELVDRSFAHADTRKSKERLLRVVEADKNLDTGMANIDALVQSGEINKKEADYRKRKLRQIWYEVSRSPSLNNVSSVISRLVEAGYMKRWYEMTDDNGDLQISDVNRPGFSACYQFTRPVNTIKPAPLRTILKKRHLDAASRRRIKYRQSDPSQISLF